VASCVKKGLFGPRILNFVSFGLYTVTAFRGKSALFLFLCHVICEAFGEDVSQPYCNVLKISCVRSMSTIFSRPRWQLQCCLLLSVLQQLVLKLRFSVAVPCCRLSWAVPACVPSTSARFNFFKNQSRLAAF